MKKIKLNVLDWCVVSFVAAAVIFGALYLVLSREGDNVRVYYTVAVEGRLKGFNKLINVGDPIVDTIRKYDMGVIHAVRVRESKDWLINERSREYFEHVFPDEEVVEITIRARARETEDYVTLSSGGGDIKVGKRMILEGKGYAVEGYIVEFSTESIESAESGGGR